MRAQIIIDKTLFIGCVLLLGAMLLVLLAALLFLIRRERLTQKRYQQERFRDPVTGGGSGAWFEKRAKKLLDANPEETYAMVYLDMERFKVINDTFGRVAGDAVLLHIYQVLENFLGKNECLARLNADSFGLLMLAGGERTMLLVERLYDAIIYINDFNFQQEQKYFLLFSFGVYEISDVSLDFNILIDRAKVACQNAKEQKGGGLACYSLFCEEDLERMTKEILYENHIENALANGEFLVYIQPKNELKSQRIAGGEALVRWDFEGKGILAPGEFVPLFERDGFIVALDRYVFRQVCNMLRCWLDAGREPVPISVNLSRAHLKNPDFFSPFEEIRSEYEVPAHWIEIELTETMAFEDTKMLVDAISKIHQLGYRCSLDDFGSGYSSLGTLRLLAMDVIKLDRTFFLENFSDGSKGRLIVQSILELARKLSIETVAEGVELPEQVAFLRESGCDMVQGYVFSRPVPVREFEQMLCTQPFQNPVTCSEAL